jgi:hypothetical protein
VAQHFCAGQKVNLTAVQTVTQDGRFGAVVEDMAYQISTSTNRCGFSGDIAINQRTTAASCSSRCDPVRAIRLQ